MVGDRYSTGLDAHTANAVNGGILKAAAESFVAIGNAGADAVGSVLGAAKNAVVNGVELNVGHDLLASLGGGFSWGSNKPEPAVASATEMVVNQPAQAVTRHADANIQPPPAAHGVEHFDAGHTGQLTAPATFATNVVRGGAMLG